MQRGMCGDSDRSRPKALLAAGQTRVLNCARQDLVACTSEFLALRYVSLSKVIMRCLDQDGASSRSVHVMLARMSVESSYDFSSINQLKATVGRLEGHDSLVT
jgi:hypothetical protein